MILKIEEGGMDQVLWSLEAIKGDGYIIVVEYLTTKT